MVKTSIMLFGILAVLNAQAQPVIDRVLLNDGELVTEGLIMTIQGQGFTLKQNPKPLLWWKADLGQNPSPLGRKTAWDDNGRFNGEVSTAVVSENSTQSYRYDHFHGGAILGRVDFDSDRLDVFRRHYDDFDVGKDYARRTRVVLNSGPAPQVGDIITGTTSGATARVQYYGPIESHQVIYYDADYGSINQQTPVDFVNGETLTSNQGAQLTNTEFKGTFRTFNNKIMRMWGGRPSERNNQYVSQRGTAAVPGSAWRAISVAEYTSVDTLEVTDSAANFNMQQQPEQWVIDEFIHQSSAVDMQNGILDWLYNGKQAWQGFDDSVPLYRRFRQRTSVDPVRYSQLYQRQVSNGTQRNSYEYFDELYVDDSWHRVVVCKVPVYVDCTKKQVQIPSQWSDTSIAVTVRQGEFEHTDDWFLYVIDGNNQVNDNGFPLMTKSPPQSSEDDLLLLVPVILSGKRGL